MKEKEKEKELEICSKPWDQDLRPFTFKLNYKRDCSLPTAGIPDVLMLCIYDLQKHLDGEW